MLVLFFVVKKLRKERIGYAGCPGIIEEVDLIERGEIIFVLGVGHEPQAFLNYFDASGRVALTEELASKAYEDISSINYLYVAFDVVANELVRISHVFPIELYHETFIERVGNDATGF